MLQVFFEHFGHIAHWRSLLIFFGGIHTLQFRAEQYTRSPAGIDHSASRCLNFSFVAVSMWGKICWDGIVLRQHLTGH
jgi:hypothetical protein